MAEIRKGSVVRACAGRDKNGFFVVLDIAKKYVIISDGKRRPVERPKRKNLRHIAVTNTVLDKASIETNKQIRKALSVFEHQEQ